MLKYLVFLLLLAVGVNSHGDTVTKLDLWAQGDSNPRQLVDAGGYIVFEAESSNTFTDSVWRSDGTQAGTFILETYSAVENFRGGRFFHHNGLTYFVADGDCVCDNPVGNEVFITDGTIDGTRVLKDINPGNADGVEVLFVSSIGNRVADMVALGDTVFFTANDGEHGNELWKTDGTEAGTEMVKDIFPGADDSVEFARLTVVGDQVFFFAKESEQIGTELWKTDGTEAGTVRVTDINPNPGASAISGASATDGIIAATSDKLFWRGHDGTEIALWVSDGTAQGTLKLVAATSGSNNSNNFMDSLIAYEDKLIFRAQTTGNGGELWISDGTVQGTNLLADLRSGGLSGLIGSTTYALIAGELYFAAEKGNFGVELWKTDGTEQGTVQMVNLNPSGDSDPEQIINVNGVLYFSARVGDRDLYRSDGTENGTYVAVRTDPSTFIDLDPRSITASGGGVFFTGFDPNIGDELFFICCDGAGNHALAAIPDIDNSGADEVAVISHMKNGTARVRVNDGVTGVLIAQPTFLGPTWTTNKTLPIDMDGTQALGLVATEDLGFMNIQLKNVADNTVIRNIFPWSGNWRFVDAVVAPNTTPSNKAAFAVLAVRKVDGLMGIELRDPDNGNRVRLVYPLGFGWTPHNLQAMQINGETALAVLSTRDSDSLTIVQIRKASDGSLIKNVFPLGFGWLPLEFKVIPDMDGNGSDEVAVRMVRESDGLDIIQIRDGTTANLIRNIYPIGAGSDLWQTQQFEVVNANGTQALAIVSIRDTDNQVLVQLKEALTGNILKNNFFIGPPWQLHDKAVVLPNIGGGSSDEIAVPMRNATTGAELVQIRDAFDTTVLRNVFVP